MLLMMGKSNLRINNYVDEKFANFGQIQWIIAHGPRLKFDKLGTTLVHLEEIAGMETCVPGGLIPDS